MRFIPVVIVALAATLGLAVAAASPSATRLVAANLSRVEIRSMPIVERPDRPGHFYGNAVRRRHRATAATPGF